MSAYMHADKSCLSSLVPCPAPRVCSNYSLVVSPALHSAVGEGGAHVSLACPDMDGIKSKFVILNRWLAEQRSGEMEDNTLWYILLTQGLNTHFHVMHCRIGWMWRSKLQASARRREESGEWLRRSGKRRRIDKQRAYRVDDHGRSG